MRIGLSLRFAAAGPQGGSAHAGPNRHKRLTGLAATTAIGALTPSVVDRRGYVSWAKLDVPAP